MLVELESYLKEQHLLQPVSASTIISDFMSFVRNQYITSGKYENFEALASALFEQIVDRPNIQTSHIVFDSHEENSPKESTRQPRPDPEMHASKIERSTPIPKQMNRLWPSPQNKVHFQCPVRNEPPIPAQKKREW